MNSNPRREADAAADGRSGRTLVSKSSILIMSGALTGACAREMLGPELDRNLFFSGMIGIAAYIALAYVAHMRRLFAQRRAEEAAASELEARIRRHVLRRSQDVSAEEPRHPAERGDCDGNYDNPRQEAAQGATLNAAALHAG